MQHVKEQTLLSVNNSSAAIIQNLQGFNKQASTLAYDLHFHSWIDMDRGPFIKDWFMAFISSADFHNLPKEQRERSFNLFRELENFLNNLDQIAFDTNCGVYEKDLLTNSKN